MENYKEIHGNLITLAKEGHFDIIAHGCNCYNTMGAGIAKTIKEEFPQAYDADLATRRGDVNKLGNFTKAEINLDLPSPATVNDMQSLGLVIKKLTIINAYTQFHFGSNHEDGDSKPVDYDAITLCMRKINHIYAGKSIGLPLIGAGLAGGEWSVIKHIIQNELKDMNVTVVHFQPEIIGKIVDVRIVEHDFSKVVRSKNLLDDIEEITKKYEFEDDKTEMKKIIDLFNEKDNEKEM